MFVYHTNHILYISTFLQILYNILLHIINKYISIDSKQIYIQFYEHYLLDPTRLLKDQTRVYRASPVTPFPIRTEQRAYRAIYPTFINKTRILTRFADDRETRYRDGSAFAGRERWKRPAWEKEAEPRRRRRVRSRVERVRAERASLAEVSLCLKGQGQREE